MKKSLIALAALGVIGTASAQVAVYGVVDIAVTQLSNDDSDSNTGLSTDGNSSSRLGFRSTTELDGGLKAKVQLEGGVAADGTKTVTGKNDTAAGNGSDVTNYTFGLNRAAFVALEGGFGELALGLQHNAIYNASSAFDPFGDNGVGAATVGATGKLGSRNLNSVNYFLPKDLGGLSGQFTYAFGETPDNDATKTAKKEGQGNLIAARVNYAVEGLTVTGGFGSLTAQSYALGDPEDITALTVGASYKFGEIVPAIAYVDNTQKDITQTAMLVGVTVGLGSGKLKASYSMLEKDTDGAKTDGSKIALGYVHSLAKSTSLYAIYASTSGDDNVVSVAATGVTSPGGWLNSGFQFGITHAF
jgi:predicted porin